MWQSLSISFRIWLSISILVFGYFVSMVVGYYHGRQTEDRIHSVSVYLVPATKYSQYAMVTFKKQIRLYQDAVLSGEKVFVESAMLTAKDLQRALASIVGLQDIDDKKKAEIEKIIEDHKKYTKEADSLYTSMSSVFGEIGEDIDLDSSAVWKKEMRNRASLLSIQTEELLSVITGCASSFSSDLSVELSMISNITKRQRIINAWTFILVVIIALSLMGFIISRSISRPLKKTFMLESAVEQSVDGIAVFDLEGYLHFGNQAWANMHGYTIDEIQGKHLSFFLDSEEYDKGFLPVWKEIEQQGASMGELSHKKKDGSFFPSTITVNLLKENMKESLVVIARDITDQKIHETELRVAKERAEDANEALHESMKMLKKTQDHLVQSEKMVALGGLVAGIAHEINTPVGIGVTAASFLEDKTIGFKKKYDENLIQRADMEKYLKIASETSSMILSNLLRAAELIKSFKQVAVDQSGEDRRVFDLKEYLNNVLISLHPKYKRTGHSIKVNCPSNIEIDAYPGAFSQVITNLVMNSLIHGFDGIKNGEIVIDVAKNDDHVEIRFQDTGKGMEEENLKMIFDPFFTTKRGRGGTGLGMHIVFNLVTQQLRGQIDCSSIPGEGMVFTIKLPLKYTAS